MWDVLLHPSRAVMAPTGPLAEALSPIVAARLEEKEEEEGLALPPPPLVAPLLEQYSGLSAESRAARFIYVGTSLDES